MPRSTQRLLLVVIRYVSHRSPPSRKAIFEAFCLELELASQGSSIETAKANL